MYKSTIIQLVLIIIGIVAFFNGLETLIGNFINVAGWLSAGYEANGTFGTVVFTRLLMSGGYFLLSYFFISRSAGWSDWIIGKAKLSSGFTAHASVTDILYFLFVIIGCSSLLNELPRFVSKIFTWFATEVGRSHEAVLPPDYRISWTQSLLSILIPVLTILLAKNLATYFAGKTNSQEEFSIMEEPEQDAD